MYTAPSVDHGTQIVGVFQLDVVVLGDIGFSKYNTASEDQRLYRGFLRMTDVVLMWFCVMIFLLILVQFPQLYWRILEIAIFVIICKFSFYYNLKYTVYNVADHIVNTYSRMSWSLSFVRTAVATRALARRGAKVLAVLGTGAQAARPRGSFCPT